MAWLGTRRQGWLSLQSGGGGLAPIFTATINDLGCVVITAARSAYPRLSVNDLGCIIITGEGVR